MPQIVITLVRFQAAMQADLRRLQRRYPRARCSCIELHERFGEMEDQAARQAGDAASVVRWQQPICTRKHAV